jgi:hypothetical protein
MVTIRRALPEEMPQVEQFYRDCDYHGQVTSGAARGLTISEYIASRDPVSGTVYLIALRRVCRHTDFRGSKVYNWHLVLSALRVRTASRRNPEMRGDVFA